MDDSAASAAVSWSHYTLVFFVSLLLWVLLVGNLNRDELVAGAFVALMVTLLFGSRFTIFTGFRFSWLAPLYILTYLANFFVALVRANLDLAARVLAPSLPINPALVEINTKLKSPLGKLLLANTITLTPAPSRSTWRTIGCWCTGCTARRVPICSKRQKRLPPRLRNT